MGIPEVIMITEFCRVSSHIKGLESSSECANRKVSKKLF